MTPTGISFMGTNSHTSIGDVGKAVAAILRERHPLQTQKMVATDLRCTPKAAENLLNGHLSAPSITRLIATYGPGVMIDAVLRSAETNLESYIRGQARHAEQEERRWAEVRRFTELQADILARSEARVAEPDGLVGRRAEPAGGLRPSPAEKS